VRVIVFGRGKLGTSLSRGLRAAGVRVTLRAGRAQPPRRLDPDAILILAVPDAQIAGLADRLAPLLGPRHVVLHCAGARGPEELAACAARGAAVAGLHPLVSFPSRKRLPGLAGAQFVAHGAPRGLRAARRVCRALGAHCSCLPVLGPAYHAAAALLANGSAALAFSAARIWGALGMPERVAERAAQSLLQSVAHNVGAVGLPAALSGPVARGDRGTVALHLRALRALTPDAAWSYEALLPVVVACARAQGLPAERARAIGALLARPTPRLFARAPEGAPRPEPGRRPRKRTKARA
jgi:predicted short-subunit dehydrogenase-like oxidoreductase (DUF2520 family)